MPSPLLLRKIAKVPTGYPTTGLVAYFDMMQDNLLLQSETFSNASWTKIRSYIAANCAADPTTGAYTVDKLVEDGTASNTHSLSQNAPGGGMTTIGWLVKSDGACTQMVTRFASTGNGSLFTLTGAGTVGSAGLTRPTADGITALGGGWYLCWMSHAIASTETCTLYLARGDWSSHSGLGHQGTAAVGGGVDTVVLAAGASAVDDVYNGTDTLYLSGTPTVPRTVTDYVGATKVLTFTPALSSGNPDGQTYTVGPGILIARAQLNPGTSLRDYQVNTDMQTLSSLYGKSPTLQRGATSGAEASDGSWGASGWGGVTDDILLGSALSDGTMAGPFDIPLVGLFNGTAGTIVSLAASGVTTHYQRVAYNGSGQIRIGSKAGAGAETFSSDLAVSTTAIVALRLRSDGTTLTLTNHATGTSVTLASQSPTGACRLGIGCTAGSTVADIASAITATLGTLHGSQLSTAGWSRAYRSLKARAARKGVVVLP